jgi:hypothetical protein
MSHPGGSTPRRKQTRGQNMSNGNKRSRTTFGRPKPSPRSDLTRHQGPFKARWGHSCGVAKPSPDGDLLITWALPRPSLYLLYWRLDKAWPPPAANTAPRLDATLQTAAARVSWFGFDLTALRYCCTPCWLSSDYSGGTFNLTKKIAMKMKCIFIVATLLDTS